jgi:hypothetical protein
VDIEKQTNQLCAHEHHPNACHLNENHFKFANIKKVNVTTAKKNSKRQAPPLGVQNLTH